MSAGDRLPTVKHVAASLVINPNTVLKAYRELEHRGPAKGRPGQGTFVEQGRIGPGREAGTAARGIAAVARPGLRGRNGHRRDRRARRDGPARRCSATRFVKSGGLHWRRERYDRHAAAVRRAG
ncbi:GntR family transcriptional regulator [Saccharopolyspora sp. TS4A08]|uniref:GntR family transcriptional regulator n=1 Tax=Saccharopolyspora ipomoeae TaxID=3042027 RepID=A0ABT6PWA6_9PSEU|nr:GntR family transcriptional regulator [Saccharopolyspora sp. TS4A08]MDI2032297.1 GntR family transcriptional regulator [Saccharopolyspora sp. TS4A08]